MTTRVALRALAALLVGACATTPPAAPQRLAECNRLFNLWARYEQHWTFHHTGQRVRAELALDACRHDHYDEAIVELKRLLRRGGFGISD